MTIRGIVFLFLFFFFVEFLQAQQPVRPEKVCLFDQISARTNPERFAGLAVDGDGHLQDYMIISSATNDARLLLPNRDPVAFSTFNNQSQKNPCMTGFGLGSPMKDKKSLTAGYVFTFKPGYSTTWFQLRPLDFGDSNGVLANTTSMWLTGFYDGVFGGESNIIRRQPEAQRLKRKYDACDKFKQNQIEPLLIRAAPGKSFNEVRVNFNYVKGKEVIVGQTSDDEFALVDICYEILVPVCNKPKNPVCTCLASHLWEKRAALRVINRFSQTIHIHWVSDTGVEGRTLSIKANSSYTINTYITHAFRIRDNCGELLYELVVTKTREDVIVTGVFTKPNCDVLCGSRRPTPTPKKATPSRRIITTTPTPHPNATTKPMVIPMDPVAPIDCIPIGAPKPEILELVVAMRDLSKTHPDMEQAYRFERHIVEGLIGVDGKPVYNATHKSITTTGQTNFNSWFNTIRGTNEEHNIAIPLRLLPGTNLYTFGSSDFFPLDNHLLGNEGDEHNYYWTMEWHTQFTYKGGETFKFTGNDDCWVYINGALVIDLGGVHGAMSREVDLDKLAPSLNLKKEYTYPFAFFFANRKKSTSDFHIQTSIVLKKDCVYIRRDKTAVNRLSSSTTKPTPPMTV